jgi:ribosomal protein S18 acetylase RimI-like enzyme
MNQFEIRSAKRSESPALLDTLKLAFATDPAFRYWWRDAASYLSTWAGFAYAMGERGFDSDTVFTTGAFEAVSFWLPPGIEPDPAQLESLDLGGSDEDEQISQELRAEQQRFHPDEPHWYLWLIGVDPALQGKGLGSALLKHTLLTCDERQEIAFLECSDPRNINFYERHGFDVIGEVQVRDMPPITPMLRKPR